VIPARVRVLADFCVSNRRFLHKPSRVGRDSQMCCTCSQVHLLTVFFFFLLFADEPEPRAQMRSPIQVFVIVSVTWFKIKTIAYF
jgi:hypothetical protein